MLSLTIAAIFLLLALMHFYWAAGGGSGSSAAIPEINGVPAFKPSTAATVAVGLVLVATAAIVLMHAGELPAPVPAWLLQTALIGAAAALFLRAIGDFRLVGFFKRVRGSRFARADTLLFSPLCLALGAALALLAAS
jgi:hypothetical protein